MEQHDHARNKKETDSERDESKISAVSHRIVTGELLWQETQRISNVTGIDFKCYYKSIPDMTVIVVQIPWDKEEAASMARRLETLGYKPVEDEDVKASGLKYDPQRRKYFGIEDEELWKKHSFS